MRLLLLCFALFISHISALGQHVRVDSLLEEFISSEQRDKIDLYTKIASGLSEIQWQEADRLVLTALNSVRQNSYEAAELSRLRGYTCSLRGKLPEAIAFVRHALEISAPLGRMEVVGRCNLDLGFYYRNLEFYSYSSQYLGEASRIFSSLDDPRKTGQAFYETALTSYRAGNFNQSVAEQKKSVRFLRAIPPQKFTAEDEFFLMSGFNTMGLAYKKLSYYDSALSCFQKADSIARKTQKEFWIKMVGGNTGEVYLLMGQAEKALPLFKTDYTAMIKDSNQELITGATLNLAEAFLKLNRLDSAVMLLSRLNEKSIPERELRQRYWIAMSKMYERKGVLARSAEALKKVVAIQDSLRLTSEAFSVTSLKTIYEVESKNESIRQLSNAIAQQQARLQRQTVFLSTSGIILVMMMVLVIMFYKFNRKNREQLSVIGRQKMEIEEKNSELEVQSQSLKAINREVEGLNAHLEERVAVRISELAVALNELNIYLYRSSHDLRRPLTALIGLSRLHRDGHVKPEELADMMEKTAHMMDGMLKKMQMAHDLEFSRPSLEYMDVVDLIQKLRHQLLSNSENAGVDFRINHNSQSTIKMLTYYRFLEIVLYNIMENAIVFSIGNNVVKPKASIDIRQSAQNTVIAVSDNGIGFHDKIGDKMFHQFFRGSEKSRGSGLGLFLVKKTLPKLEGTIDIHSEPFNGSTITLTFPNVLIS